MQNAFLKNCLSTGDVTGTHSDRFEVFLDQNIQYNDKPSLTIQSKTAGEEGLCVFAIRLLFALSGLANDYESVRILERRRLKEHAVISIYLKTQSDEIVVYDAMIDRSLRGDNDWQQLETVFDVPEGCRFIYFGPALWGRGKMWVADFARCTGF